LTAADGQSITGKVRAIAPTVDMQTRNGLVYVDLPGEAIKHFSAGMFARGEFQLAGSTALTLPQSAIVLREGFAYVFRIESEKEELAKIAQTKISTGRRNGDLIEVSGIDATTKIVASGAGFLADGDTVKIVAVDKQP
jgi:multidrug efflux pump subunit AcrA (membrane-fusion protein)